MCNKSTDTLMETDQTGNLLIWRFILVPFGLIYNSLVMSFRIYISQHSYQSEKYFICMFFRSQKSYNLASLSSNRIFNNYLFTLEYNSLYWEFILRVSVVSQWLRAHTMGSNLSSVSVGSVTLSRFMSQFYHW